MSHSGTLKTTGFTLIELSIVLVIIGLVIGGILAGQALIKQAEYKNQMNQLEAIKKAHYTFITKYNCIPGDCPRMSTFFSEISSLDNGDGDDRLECWYGGVDECNTYYYVLTLANLLEAKPVDGQIPMYAYYKGKLNNSTIYVNYTDRYGAFVDDQGVAYVHLITPNNPWAEGAILTTLDAQQMDVKLDDGKAGSGIYRGINGGDALGAPQACLSGGEYDLAQTTKNCRIDYKIQ